MRFRFYEGASEKNRCKRTGRGRGYFMLSASVFTLWRNALT
ncbi:hypothetical protein EGY04_21555 [Enterobacter roggenkampii]|nr:hypothetical protein EGY04_21555 [Enterobacter roggenkampii]MBA7914245.1 hypothetical protein [Enterobacter roggenkampii]QLU95775.1 hypothetical protein HV268_04685 [Enterobacter roggenkampii]QMR83121.1 hypothetical protein HV097_21290 [Enterobacter roggenkampii]HDR2852794.1 hypothetical protein [Enterobacter roggenkampii]